MGKGYEVAQKTRGRAAPDRQLSKLQRRILIWIFRPQSTIEILGKVGNDVGVRGKGIPVGRKFNEYVRELGQKGIPWSAKRFYDDHSLTRSQEASVATALRALERRGLVVKLDSAGGLGRKPRTTHVKLTATGCEVAAFLIRNKGESQQEVEKEKLRATRSTRARLNTVRKELAYQKHRLTELEVEKTGVELMGEGVIPSELHNIKARVKSLEEDLKGWQEILEGEIARYEGAKLKAEIEAELEGFCDLADDDSDIIYSWEDDELGDNVDDGGLEI